MNTSCLTRASRSDSLTVPLELARTPKSGGHATLTRLTPSTPHVSPLSKEGERVQEAVYRSDSSVKRESRS